jgi:DNA-binding MarR family transcriptional regulator
MAKAKRGARAARKRKPGANDGAGAATVLALDEAPGHLLRRCHQRSREIYESLLGRRGLSRQQFAVLIAMSANPGASLTRISAATGFDRNTLAEMIGRLVKKGYVTRRRSAADARASAMALTQKGRRYVRETMSRAHEVQRRILEPLPASLRPVFVHCLRLLLGLDQPAPAIRTAAGMDLSLMTPGVPCAPLAPETAGGIPTGGTRVIDASDPGLLRTLEESMWRAETRFDPDHMERLLSPEFFEFGRSGRIYTREEIIGMRGGAVPVIFPLLDFKVTAIDPQVALVTYVSEVRRNGVERGNRSSLWRKTPAGWEMTFHQGTAVFEGRDVSD